MYSETADPNNKDHYYKFDPINATDNKGLDKIAAKLELIYTSLDWPFQTPSLEVSLYQSGIYGNFSRKIEFDIKKINQLIHAFY